MFKIFIMSSIFLLISFNASARDSLFYGVWGSDQNGFKSVWGNFLINEKQIYWGRLDKKLWKSDLDNYACSVDYEIVQRGKGKSFPDDSHASLNSDDIYIYVRYKLNNKRCNYTKMPNPHYSKKLVYLQLSTGYRGLYGGNATIIAYDLNKKTMGGGSASKINHLPK